MRSKGGEARLRCKLVHISTVHDSLVKTSSAGFQTSKSGSKGAGSRDGPINNEEHAAAHVAPKRNDVRILRELEQSSGDVASTANKD